MRTAIKNLKKIVKAYQLGAASSMEKELLKEGAMILKEDGSYELFSQEAVNKSGEIAQKGDYFKVDVVDGKHFPYPNKKDWFESNHILIEENTYEQKNKPLFIWEVSDPMSEEVQYLMDNNKLTLKPDDPDHYFNAFLWGADLTANSDATLLFYNIERDKDGKIKDIEFNFVAKEEFVKNYSYC